MKIKIYCLSFLLFLFFFDSNAQMIELTFTGKSDSFHVPLNYILIENMTQGGDTILYSPDTVIVLGTVGINEGFKNNNFMVQQNYPNPFNNQTVINIYMPEESYLDISIHNAIGKEVTSYKNNLNRGFHSFSFRPGNEKFYFLTSIYKSEVKTIKMLTVSSDPKQNCDLSYDGLISYNATLKSHKSSKGFVYSLGDQLKFVGYTGADSDTIIDSPGFDVTYEFEFNLGFPCPGIPSFVFGGQTYTTVQIGSQCWMAENMNIGIMINSTSNQGNNGIIEKYCYNNDTNKCNTYGGLYQWNEMMQYVSTVGTQGICPAGWHLPANVEWTELTDYLGSMSIAGGKMKEPGTVHWYSPNTGATNSSGFTTLPGGYYDHSSSFVSLGIYGNFWSSMEYDSSDAWGWRLSYITTNVYTDNYTRKHGLTVRCLKDCTPLPTQANAGPDSVNIVGDSIALMGNTAVIGQGLWTIFSGGGGNFADSTNPTTIFYGLPGNTYNLVWTISNICGSSSDTVIINFEMSYPNCGIITDIRDGRTYNTVIIGSQCWMAENLNIGTRINSGSGGQLQTDNGIIEKFCYNNYEYNCDIYG
ncbi:MAG: hypothetical protein K8S00_02775, partial [Bacteroidales bacterium]|nr:hypothetical protein [Bacteroidales bacterium]